MAEAYSGSEARDFVSGAQSGVPTGPYRQSYQYSSFNQVTQQTNRLWDHNEVATNTVVNNRMQYWGYDAAGAVVYADETSYKRDAAGRNVQTDSEFSHGTYTFDGDGNALKTVLTTPGFRGGTRTTTVHYLRSSVLGAAVAELNSVGLKMKRYVYAGGRKLAEEFGGNFTWSHAEPVTGSRGDSTTAGAYIPKAEFNADGVNVGFYAPESNGFDSPDPIAPWGNLGLGSNCSVGNPNCVTCYIQGIEHGCGQVARLMERGIAAQCPNNDCGPNWNPDRDGLGRGGWETLYLLPSGFSYEPIGPSRQPSGRPPVLRKPGPRPPGAGPGNRDPYDNGDNEGSLPQKPWGPRLTKDEYLAIRKEMEKALQSEKCRSFIDTLVRYNSDQYIDSQEEIPAFADYMFNLQDGGIFWSAGGAGGINMGRKIRLGSGFRPDLNVKSDAEFIMHELIHGLTRGADDRLDRDLRDLGITPIGPNGTPLPFPTGMRDGKPYNDWSGYWDQALKNACFPTMR